DSHLRPEPRFRADRFSKPSRPPAARGEAMAELENSARRQLRATYTPLRIPDDRKPTIGGARAKYALAARLQITPSELERLTRRQPIDPDVRGALARVAGPHNGSTLVEAMQPFAEIEWPALTAIAERLAQL